MWVGENIKARMRRDASGDKRGNTHTHTCVLLVSSQGAFVFTHSTDHYVPLGHTNPLILYT